MNGFKGTPSLWWASGLDVGTVPMMDVKVAKVSGADFEQAKANALLIAQCPAMAALLNEINNWLVCACIATPEDMAQSFEGFQKQIDEVLTAGGFQ